MLAILLCAVVGADSDVEPKPKTKPATPPSMVQVYLSGDRLVSRTEVTVTKKVPVKKTVANKGGKTEEVVQLVAVPELRVVEIFHSLTTLEAKTAGGKALDVEEVKKRLLRPQVVVMSGDGKAIAQAFLDALDKETIVLVPRQVRPK